MTSLERFHVEFQGVYLQKSLGFQAEEGEKQMALLQAGKFLMDPTVDPLEMTQKTLQPLEFGRGNGDKTSHKIAEGFFVSHSKLFTFENEYMSFGKN